MKLYKTTVYVNHDAYLMYCEVTRYLSINAICSEVAYTDTLHGDIDKAAATYGAAMNDPYHLICLGYRGESKTDKVPLQLFADLMQVCIAAHDAILAQAYKA